MPDGFENMDTSHLSDIRRAGASPLLEERISLGSFPETTQNFCQQDPPTEEEDEGFFRVPESLFREKHYFV